MKSTIVVCGHGPGISDAVARKFGAEGHPVALVARNKERLEAAAAALAGSGVKAQAFPCDLGDAEAVKGMIGAVRAALGPIGVLHYNAYSGGAGDLTKASASELRGVFDTAVSGLLAATQAAFEDLRSNKGALLVTGGGFAFYDAKVDAMATQFNSMGLAVAKAAQHKTVGLLSQKLGPEGIYVGEVVVLGLVKGTAFDHGSATLEPADIAAKFWELAEQRTTLSVNFPS
ncbi:MAG: SDR family NAD(P)-dependent oxidoreductase [Polyangiaceae bacterium]